MPKPQLHVVPELLAPCRAAKGIVGALLVIALTGLISVTARTPPDAGPAAASMREAIVASSVAPRAAPADRVEYFPAGYTLDAIEPAPHIEAF